LLNSKRKGKIRPLTGVQVMRNRNVVLAMKMVYDLALWKLMPLTKELVTRADRPKCSIRESTKARVRLGHVELLKWNALLEKR